MTAPEAAPRRVYLLNLQLLRFVAATMVVLLHGVQRYREMGGTWAALTWPQYVGDAGVDIFFVLSGFIIWTTNPRRNPAGAPRYLYKRLARIYLGYWPFFLAAVGMKLWLSPDDLERVDYVRSFFLWPQRQVGQVLHVSWTLSYELYFYGLFFLLLFARRRMLWLHALTGLVVLANVYTIGVLEADEVGNHRLLTPMERFLTSSHLLQFFLGCYLASWVGRGWRRGGLTALALGLALLPVGALAVHHQFAESSFVGRMVYGVAAAGLVYGLVSIESEGRRPFPRLAELGGGASYTIYLSHTVIYQAAGRLGLLEWVRESAMPAAVAYGALVAAILAISVAFSLLVEGPLYRGAQRLWPKPAPARAAERAGGTTGVGPGAV